VARYDRRGYATNSDHPGPHTVAANVDDLRAVIGGRRAVVFGHSFGGVVALAAAAVDPAIVAVATYEAPLSWLDWWPHPAWSAAEPGDSAEAFIRRLAGDAAWEQMPEPARERRRGEGAVLVREMSDCRRAAPCDLGRIHVPVRVGVGGEAMAHHRRGAEQLASALPRATLVQIAGATHFAHRTHASEIAEALIAPLVSDVSTPADAEEDGQLGTSIETS
jgi:pimeloyl-ACP methyl ester carboxylesterase